MRGDTIIAVHDREGLSEWLAEQLGARSVDDIERLTGGASRETYRFVADGRPLVVQRQRPGVDRSLIDEARVVSLAAAKQVPVAEILSSGSDPDGLEFLVTVAIEGETVPRRILRDERFATARRLLPAQLASALARVHTVQPGEVPFLEDGDELVTYRRYVDELGIVNPVFELALRWLHRHRPSGGRRSLVHGDFRLGNLIVGDDGLRAVIDWELAHIGDPMEDLGWLCAPAWRFGAELPVAGVGSYSDLFAAYEAEGGSHVDHDVVAWWRTLAALKWGVMCVLQARAHLEGAARSHELAAIGRRVPQTEYDLLVDLGGPW